MNVRAKVLHYTDFRHGITCILQKLNFFAVIVDGKEVSVTDAEGDADIELDHRDAIMFIGGLYSKDRLCIPTFAQSWFPLDFFSYSLDNV